MSKVAGNDVDATAEFMYSETYGLIRRIPYFVGHDKFSNMYKLLQAIDREKYRLDDVLEIFVNYRKLYGDLWEQAIGEKLTQIGNDLGIKRVLYEPHTSYVNRIYNLSNFSIIGGTEEEIRSAIYYFIDSDTFNKTEHINIINPYEDTVYLFFTEVSATVDFETQLAPETDLRYFISEAQIGDELFQIIISLPTGSADDRASYQYWTTEENLGLLYSFIKSLSPIGMLFTIKIEMI